MNIWLSLYDLEPTASFDIVFCLGVIYHVTDPIVALRRIYHVMKPAAKPITLWPWPACLPI